MNNNYYIYHHFIVAHFTCTSLKNLYLYRLYNSQNQILIVPKKTIFFLITHMPQGRYVIISFKFCFFQLDTIPKTFPFLIQILNY